MWPAATSTTMPSGSFRPSLTMVFKSEPSGFEERTRPAARSKKYKRPTVFAADFTVSDLEALEDGIGITFSFLVFSLFERRCSRTASYCLESWLHKGAEPGDSFAENQILHLERALIGVKGF